LSKNNTGMAALRAGLPVKMEQLSIVYNHRTLRHAMTKNYVISGKLHFHFSGE